MKSTILVTFVGLTVLGAVGAQFLVCHPTPQEFSAFCDSHSGLVIGGQCYFYVGPDGSISWFDSWKLCQAQGATMAQIHSTYELNTIADFLTSTYPDCDGPWLALRRYTNDPDGLAMPLNATYWHDTPDTYIPLLTAGNSWVRIHQLDDGNPDDQFCYQMWRTGLKYVHDDLCTGLFDGLCQFTNTYQTFTKVAGVCVNETAIETYNNVDINACATNCATKVWCRSFNYYNDQTCELFPWSIADNPAQRNDPSCYHYTNKL